MDLKNRWFLCKVCKLYIRRPSAFVVHTRIHQNGQPRRSTESTPDPVSLDANYQCNLCPALLTSINDKDQHVRQIHHQNPYSCSKCSQNFPTPNQYNSHIWNIHNGTCDICDKTLKQRNSLKRHTTAHYKIWKCVKCTEFFSTSGILQAHSKIHKVKELRPTSVYTCSLCSKSFKSKPPLREHIAAVHTGEHRYKCEDCSETFAYHWSYRNHKKRFHGKSENKRLECGLCTQDFKDVKALNYHRESVHEMVRHQCPLCQKMLLSKTSLWSHLKTHSDERPYECIVCNAKFKTSTALKTHKRLHSSKKDFLCSTCGKSCTTLSGLRKHSLVHSDEKPFLCNVCGDLFKTRELINNHLRKHTDERPFACKFCDKKFKNISNVWLHERIHTGVKVKCHQCERKFFKRQQMIQHFQKCHSSGGGSKGGDCGASEVEILLL